MITIQDLKKYYGKKLVLDVDKVSFLDGTIYGIFGANGSGKSTLLKCLEQLVECRGKIEIDNINLHESIGALKSVGSMIETVSFINNLTARENLKYFLEDDSAAIEVLNQLNMSEYLDDIVKTYSVGMKQKLAFALACARGKKVILLDEPFNGMDVYSVKKCITILKTIKQQGVLIVVTSHDVDALDRLCDAFMTIRGKKIVQIEEKYLVKRKYVIAFNSEENAMNAIRKLCDFDLQDIGDNSIELLIDKYIMDEDVLKLLENMEYSIVSKEEVK